MGGKLTFRKIGGRIVPIISKGNVHTPLRATQSEASVLKKTAGSIPAVRAGVKAGNRRMAAHRMLTRTTGLQAGHMIRQILKRGKKGSK